MKNRIDNRFAELRAKRRKGFIPYICAGDPSLKKTVELGLALEKSGADLLELGCGCMLGSSAAFSEAASTLVPVGYTPPPPVTDLFRDVYDDREPGPEPLRKRLERILATNLTANN